METSSLAVRFVSRILGFIYQFFLGKYIEIKYIMPMYIKSHTDYASRTSIGQHWIDTYQDLEVSFQTSTRFCENPSKIAIRNNSDIIFGEVVLLVEAEGYFDGSFKNEYYTAQQTLVFRDVGSSPKIKCLTDIPPIDFWTLDNGNVIFSYKDFSVCLVSVTERGKSKIVQYKKKIFSFYKSNYLDDLFKGNWQEKAGRYYNIAYINRAKLDLSERIWSDLNPPATLVTMKEYLKINVFLRKYWEFSSLLNKIRCYFLLQDKLVSVRFWILIMLGRHSEDEDGRLKFNRYFLF